MLRVGTAGRIHPLGSHLTAPLIHSPVFRDGSPYYCNVYLFKASLTRRCHAAAVPFRQNFQSTHCPYLLRLIPVGSGTSEGFTWVGVMGFNDFSLSILLEFGTAGQSFTGFNSLTLDFSINITHACFKHHAAAVPGATLCRSCLPANLPTLACIRHFLLSRVGLSRQELHRFLTLLFSLPIRILPTKHLRVG